MLSAIQGFDKAGLKPATTIERSLQPVSAPSLTTWVKGADGKWYEVAAATAVSEGEAGTARPMQAAVHEMHGQCYGFQKDRDGWAAPRLTFNSDVAARPGYDTLDASEYLEVPAVLRQKVAKLASLVRRAKCCVVYAGAGLSTSAGIGDYATQANSPGTGEQRETLRSPLCAQPTAAHRVLVAMHAKGLIHRLVQQNHGAMSRTPI